MLFFEYTRARPEWSVSRRWFKKELEIYLKRISVPRSERYFLSLALVGNTVMRRLNRQYRHKDKVTDVLALEGKTLAVFLPWRGTFFLGEIVICYPQAIKQAREYGVSARVELRRLLIHGFLHVLGYDHIKKKDAKIMRSLEYTLDKKV